MIGDDSRCGESGRNARCDDVQRFDWTAHGEPSSGIVEAVARSTGREVTALPPLHDAVETDALNALLADGVGSADGAVDVTFSYAKHRITVSADGDVEISPSKR